MRTCDAKVFYLWVESCRPTVRPGDLVQRAQREPNTVILWNLEDDVYEPFAQMRSS
jgi:hypothetical protein